MPLKSWCQRAILFYRSAKTYQVLFGQLFYLGRCNSILVSYIQIHLYIQTHIIINCNKKTFHHTQKLLPSVVIDEVNKAELWNRHAVNVKSRVTVLPFAKLYPSKNTQKLYFRCFLPFEKLVNVQKR